MDTNGKVTMDLTIQDTTATFRIPDIEMEAQQRRSKKVTIRSIAESEESYDAHSLGEQNHGSQVSLASVLPPEPKERRLVLETALTLMYISTGFIGTVYKTHLMYQSCTNIFHYSDDVCEPLLGKTEATNATLEAEAVVQPYVANITLTTNLITTILPAILTLFIGPWSDKHGRRPVLFISMFGYFLGSIILTILSLFKTIHPWIYVVYTVPIAVTGGLCAILTLTYSYIADVILPHKRAIRMVLNNSSVITGSSLGTLLSGYLLAATNPTTIYGVSAVLVVLAMVYVYFIGTESVEPNYESPMSKIKAFFRFVLVVDLFKTCFKRRQHIERAIIWLSLVCIVLTYFAEQGAENGEYQFLQKQFNVTLKPYKEFRAITRFIQISGGIAGVIVFKKVFKMSETFITMIAIVALTAQTMVSASAQKFWEMYMGSVFGIMGSIVIPMLLAIISLILPATEIGKFFGLTISLQTIGPLAAVPLYTAVYNATMNYYPGLFNVISIALYLLCFGIVLSTFSIQKALDISMV